MAATDILDNFVIRSDLTLTEIITLNYAIKTKDKAKTISHSMNFIARSAVQKALSSLHKKYKIITIYSDWSIQINFEFNPEMYEYKIHNATWRPPKEKQFTI